jgi:hypothetical protein
MDIDASSRHDPSANVLCSVRLKPIYGLGFHTLWHTDAQSAHWVRDNVECALYAGAHREADLAELRAMMNAMHAQRACDMKSRRGGCRHGGKPTRSVTFRRKSSCERSEQISDGD